MSRKGTARVERHIKAGPRGAPVPAWMITYCEEGGEPVSILLPVDAFGAVADCVGVLAGDGKKTEVSHTWWVES
jgi:hypothetical protein